MKMERTEYSETLTFKLQTPVNHPEESIQPNLTCNTVVKTMLEFGKIRSVYDLYLCVTVWSRFMFCSSVSFMSVYRVILYWGESTGWRTILTALLRVVNNA
jgi:hypothetical protein